MVDRVILAPETVDDEEPGQAAATFDGERIVLVGCRRERGRAPDPGGECRRGCRRRLRGRRADRRPRHGSRFGACRGDGDPHPGGAGELGLGRGRVRRHPAVRQRRRRDRGGRPDASSSLAQASASTLSSPSRPTQPTPMPTTSKSSSTRSSSTTRSSSSRVRRCSTESAFAVIDRLTQLAQRFSGIAITVEGHTDSDGATIENLQLSQNRAEAVQAALVERSRTDCRGGRASAASGPSSSTVSRTRRPAVGSSSA